MKSLNEQQLIEQYNKGYTIVLFTSIDTILLKLNVSCSDTLNEILNTGLYRHNLVTHGRILRWINVYNSVLYMRRKI